MGGTPGVAATSPVCGCPVGLGASMRAPCSLASGWPVAESSPQSLGPGSVMHPPCRAMCMCVCVCVCVCVIRCVRVQCHFLCVTQLCRCVYVCAPAVCLCWCPGFCDPGHPPAPGGCRTRERLTGMGTPPAPRTGCKTGEAGLWKVAVT